MPARHRENATGKQRADRLLNGCRGRSVFDPSPVPAHLAGPAISCSGGAADLRVGQAGQEGADAGHVDQRAAAVLQQPDLALTRRAVERGAREASGSRCLRERDGQWRDDRDGSGSVVHRCAP